MMGSSAAYTGHAYTVPYTVMQGRKAKL